MGEANSRPPPPEGFTPVEQSKASGKPPPPEGFTPVTGFTGYPQPQGQDPWKPDPVDNVGDRAKLMGGMAELGFMFATQGATELYSGIAGLITLGITGDMDAAANRINQLQNDWAYNPKSDGAQYFLRQAMPALSRADTAINDFAEKQSMYIDENGEEQSNPAVAAAIKTAIWGSVDIVAAAYPVGKGVKARAKIVRELDPDANYLMSFTPSALKKARRQIIAEAANHGIRLTMDDFADDVANAGKELGSSFAGEKAIEYTQAIRDAEKAAAKHKKSMYAAAKAEKLYVETSPVRQLGHRLIQEIDGSYPLDAKEMASVREVLTDLIGEGKRRGLGSGTGFEVGQNIAVHFSQLERMRQIINRRIRSALRSQDGDMAASALIHIRDGLDGWLTAEFNKASIQNGRIVSTGQALSGDAAGLQAYKAARVAAQEHAWFSEIKVIADLVKKDATTTEAAQWIIGASPVAKHGSASVVKRMKLLLGDDHPAIAALREDFIFQLTKPLFVPEGQTPNYKAFLNNWEKVLLNNRPLADAFGLDQTDIKAITDYARVVTQNPNLRVPGAPKPRFLSLKELVQTTGRLAVGSGVAKGAARVGFWTKIGNMIAGVDNISAKAIGDAAIDARFDLPLIPKDTPLYAAIIAAAALTPSQEQYNTFPGNRGELKDSWERQLVDKAVEASKNLVPEKEQ